MFRGASTVAAFSDVIKEEFAPEIETLNERGAEIVRDSISVELDKGANTLTVSFKLPSLEFEP